MDFHFSDNSQVFQREVLRSRRYSTTVVNRPNMVRHSFRLLQRRNWCLKSPSLSVLPSAQVPSSPIRVPSTRLHQIKQVRKDGLIRRKCYNGNVHVIPTGSDGILNMPARVTVCGDHSSSPFHSGSRASLAEMLTHLKH